METQIEKDERIEIRVSATDKSLFKKAQKFSGDKSFSSFIVRILKTHAEEIIAKNDKILATERDREIFFDAVFGHIQPNENLINAAKKYKANSQK